MVLRAGEPIVPPSVRGGGPRSRTVAPGRAASSVVAGAMAFGATRLVEGGDPARSGPADAGSSPGGHPPAEGRSRSDRRRFLRNAAIAGGAAWVAPTVLTLNTPAAANSGACSGPPTYAGYREASAIGVTNGPFTGTMTPTGIPLSSSAMLHIAVGNVDHIINMPASSFATPPGWTLLGTYDSDVTGIGTTGVGLTTNWSQRTYIWWRRVNLQSSYSFDVTMTGDATYQPQARVVVAAYENVNGIANTPGEFLLQGSGVISPVSPPTSAVTNIPSITANLPATLAVGITSASNVSSVNTLTPPALYTLNVTANTGAGYPPIWIFSKVVPSGTIPATTGTIVPGAMNIGGQLTIECG